MRTEVAALRRTSLGWLFARVAHAVERFAASEGRYIRVEITGAELLIDRRAAERLLETVIQLARNAVAHGIQRPEQRVAKGKPPVGTIALRAERLGDWLRIVVEDDGEGVDVERIRELAVQRGVVPDRVRRVASRGRAFGAVVPPRVHHPGGCGFAGRPRRGTGSGARRRCAGWAVRFVSAAGRGSGLTATVDVPGERGLVDVLWLRAAGWEFALPVSFTGRVELTPMQMPVVPLTTCLGLSCRAVLEARARAVHARRAADRRRNRRRGRVPGSRRSGQFRRWSPRPVRTPARCCAETVRCVWCWIRRCSPRAPGHTRADRRRSAG